MFGLVVLAVAALYFSVMFMAVRWAWRSEIGQGGTRGRAFRKAFFVFLLIYLPVFWDHIPTLVVHRAMCAKDAGFTAHVDAQQWHEKNADAVAAVNGLSRREREASVQLPTAPDGFDRYVGFGGLLRSDYKYERVVPWLTVGRTEQRVADAKTGEVLAVAIDYGAGGPSSAENLRWWLRTGGCFDAPPSANLQPDKPTTPIGYIRWFKYSLKGEHP